MRELLFKDYELEKDETLKISSSTNLIIGKDKELTSYIYLDLIDDKRIDLNISIDSYSHIKIVLISLSKSASYDLKVNLDNSAYLSLFLVDLSSNKLDSNKTISLNGENAEFSLYEYVSTKDKERQNGFVQVVHNAKNTTSNTKLIYLSKDDSIITKKAISKINNNMDNSNASENIRGIILGDDAKIIAEPILLIDHDDVHASHGCAIGTLDDNEIYYLMSRGLSKDEAIKIICASLINPILKEIKDKEFLDFVYPHLMSSVEA